MIRLTFALLVLSSWLPSAFAQPVAFHDEEVTGGHVDIRVVVYAPDVEARTPPGIFVYDLVRNRELLDSALRIDRMLREENVEGRDAPLGGVAQELHRT